MDSIEWNLVCADADAVRRRRIENALVDAAARLNIELRLIKL